MKSALLGFTLTLLLTCAAFAQDKTLALQLNDQNVKVMNEAGRPVMQIDLLGELRKQHGAAVPAGLIEIKGISVEAKSRLGGGQIMLKIQRDKGVARYVDLKRVETDPAIFDSNDGFQHVELSNFERGLKGAELVVVSGVRLRNLQVVLGQGEELKILGTYAGFDGTKVTGARSSQTPTVATPVAEEKPAETRPIIPIPRPGAIERRELPPVNNEPVVITPDVQEPAPVVKREEKKPVPKREEPKVQAARCLQNFCVGQAVYHRRTYWEGVIIKVDTRKNQLIVKFGYDTDAFEAPVSPKDLDFN